jgi:hypothetical protein
MPHVNRTRVVAEPQPILVERYGDGMLTIRLGAGERETPLIEQVFRVEPRGFDPLTSAVQRRRSPN